MLFVRQTPSDMPSQTQPTSPSSSVTISIWEPSLAGVTPLYTIFQSTLASSGWSMPSEKKLHHLLTVPDCTVFLARSSSPSSPSPGPITGFVLATTMPAGYDSALLKGCLALICVDPAHQGQGIGTALHTHAVEFLRGKVVPTVPIPLDVEPSASRRSLMLGSIFPRIFPGLPKNLGEGTKRWFTRRGWRFGEQESRDLYMPIGKAEEAGKAEEGRELLRRMEEQGVRYGVMEKGKEEELYALQAKEFTWYPVSTKEGKIDCGDKRMKLTNAFLPLSCGGIRAGYRSSTLSSTATGSRISSARTIRSLARSSVPSSRPMGSCTKGLPGRERSVRPLRQFLGSIRHLTH